MKDSEKREAIERYNERFAQFGHDPRTLGWPKRRHVLRYAILLGEWELAGRSLLDYGCGFGDMYGYCVEHKPGVEYAGVDINPKLIEEGRRLYPAAELILADEEDPDRRYDFVVSSGVHNAKIGDNWSFIEESFALFDRLATSGFALNFLSNRVQYELEHTYHADPVRVLELAYRYSNRVVLRNDYMPFEFTVFVDKRTEFDQEHVVYPEFRALITEDDGPS